MIRRECRSTEHGSYDGYVVHVAPYDCLRRHARLGMSLITTRWSDIVDAACRTAHETEATCSPCHVALHERVERHAASTMSLHSRFQSDMIALSCRSAHLGSLARPIHPGDIHPRACRTTRVGRVTCCGHKGDEHERDCRSKARKPWDLVRQAGRPPCPRIQRLSWFTVRLPSASPRRSLVSSWAGIGAPSAAARFPRPTAAA